MVLLYHDSILPNTKLSSVVCVLQVISVRLVLFKVNIERKSKEINQEEMRIVLRLFRKAKSFKEIGEITRRPITTLKRPPL